VPGAGRVADLSLAGETVVTEVSPAGTRSFTVVPEDAGLERAPVEALRVRSLAEATARLRAILQGEPGPLRDVTCLNAAAGLVVGGGVPDLRAGAELARAALDSGAASRGVSVLVAVFAS